jgi:hypothetical protein
VIDWISGKILEVTALVRGASVLGAIVMVAFAYYKARSLVAVLVAALTAGVFLWSISILDWWQDKVQEESGTLGPLGVTAEVVEPVQPAGAAIVL